MDLWLQAAGWLGTAVYLATHWMRSSVSHHRSPWFFMMDLIAALLIVFSSFALQSWQAVAINVFWAFVSFSALAKISLPHTVGSNNHLFAALIVMFASGCLLLPFHPLIGFSIWGWSSTLAFCLGYWRYTAERLPLTHYLFLNAYAAAVLIPQLLLDHNWPVFVLEVFWTGISLFGGWRTLRLTHQPHS